MKMSPIVGCFCLGLALGQRMTAQEHLTSPPEGASISPDKKWEYKCIEYGPGSCAPGIAQAGTTKVVLDLDQDVNGTESSEAQVVWAPDSQRFGFNYSPPHAHHTTYKTAALYQLRAEKWETLRSPEDELVKLARELLPKRLHKSNDELIPDIVKVRSWPDAGTAILLSAWHPWEYSSHSNPLSAAFLLTLKFDDNGDWKVVKKHRLSEKEIEKLGTED